MAKKKEINISTKKTINSGVKKIKILFTIVNKSKALFYMDLLEGFEINMQMVIQGKGTANTEMLNLLGIVESDKAVIISCVREDKVNEVLESLKEKFDKIKNSNGIAYIIPVQSIIGTYIYQFLSNNKTNIKEVGNNE